MQTSEITVKLKSNLYVAPVNMFPNYNTDILRVYGIYSS